MQDQQTEQTTSAPVLVEAGALAPQIRDGNGRFVPGSVPNPGGRPKGFASYIREQTNGGKELVDFAITVLRSRRPVKYRLQAMEWLADRGFGKVVQPHEVTGEDGGAVVFTLKLGERADE